MTYHSSSYLRLEKLNVHDIFYAEHYDNKGKKNGHYFYCIYTQEEDQFNDLFRDVVGLLITTKKPKGYTCQLKINGKTAWVCCDREIRFMAKRGIVQKKYFKPELEERKRVYRCHRRFQKERTRQMKKGFQI